MKPATRPPVSQPLLVSLIFALGGAAACTLAACALEGDGSSPSAADDATGSTAESSIVLARYIPGAESDCTPAVAVQGGRLLVAFKRRGSDGIRLASTATPDDSTSWSVTDLALSLPEPGPAQIRTSDCPALSVVGNELWLTFRGHNNPNIWVTSQRGSRWSGHGAIGGTQTAKGPAMAGTMVAHRGNADRAIWYVDRQAIPNTDRRIDGTASDDSPAIAYYTPTATGTSAPTSQLHVAFRADDDAILTTRYAYLPEGHWGWTPPRAIPLSRSSARPALAMHQGKLYAAFKATDGGHIWLATYDGVSWIHIEAPVPGVSTATGPALVDFAGRLFVVFAAPNGRVGYSVASPAAPIGLTIVTVNARIKDTEPHRYQSWWFRLPRLVSMLETYSPDIVGVQELDESQYDDVRHSRLGGAYRSFWYRRGGSIFWSPGEGLAILYRGSRLALLAHGRITVTPDERSVRGRCPDDVDLDGANRIIVWGRFRDGVSGRAFYVYNTHFPTRNSCGRRGMAKIMAEQIANRDTADPVIALGDFNEGQVKSDAGDVGATIEYEPSFQRFLDLSGLVNSYREIQPFFPGDEYATGTGYTNERHERMIDFVLASPSVQMLDADIDRTRFPRDEDCSPYSCAVYHNDEPIDCYTMVSGECMTRDRLPTGRQGDDLVPYSDHWAVWARLTLTTPPCRYGQVMGSAGFCSAECACGRGEGGCDADADCQPGLFCRAQRGSSSSTCQP